MKHAKMMSDLSKAPSWFKEEPEEKLYCDLCGRPIEKPDEPEDFRGQPCHGTCKENYIFELRYGDRDYEPE